MDKEKYRLRYSFILKLLISKLVNKFLKNGNSREENFQ